MVGIVGMVVALGGTCAVLLGLEEERIDLVERTEEE